MLFFIVSSAERQPSTPPLFPFLFSFTNHFSSQQAPPKKKAKAPLSQLLHQQAAAQQDQEHEHERQVLAFSDLFCVRLITKLFSSFSSSSSSACHQSGSSSGGGRGGCGSGSADGFLWQEGGTLSQNLSPSRCSEASSLPSRSLAVATTTRTVSPFTPRQQQTQTQTQVQIQAQTLPQTEKQAQTQTKTKLLQEAAVEDQVQVAGCRVSVEALTTVRRRGKGR